MFFLFFILQPFILLETEFHIFFLFILIFFNFFGVIIFSFDLLEINFRTLFPVFFCMRLSQSYIYGREVCELTWFNWVFLFYFNPSTLSSFTIQVGLYRVFFYLFLLSLFFVSLFSIIIYFLIILFKLLIKSLTGVLNIFPQHSLFMNFFFLLGPQREPQIYVKSRQVLPVPNS
jgi:hypothetical protein